jgi:hypothetical protein
MMRPQFFLRIPGSPGASCEGRAEIDRDDRVPLLDRKVLDVGHMLDARVVDQDVHAAEVAPRVGDEVRDVAGLAHVGAVVAHLHAELADLLLRAVDIAESVEHDVGALARQAEGDAEADAAGGSGHQRSLSFEHGELSC